MIRRPPLLPPRANTALEEALQLLGSQVAPEYATNPRTLRARAVSAVSAATGVDRQAIWRLAHCRPILGEAAVLAWLSERTGVPVAEMATRPDR